MQIEQVELQRIRIPFRSGFRHALQERHASDAILVTLRSRAGVAGVGEIVPRDYLTGETLDSVWSRHAPVLAHAWLGARWSSQDEVVAWLEVQLGPSDALATFAGFELATLDAAGQEMGFDAADVLGRPAGAELPAGIVLGFETPTEALPKQCAALRALGRRHVKVKVGRPDDVERVEIVCRTLGQSASVRIDANGAWSASEAVDVLARMRHLDLHSVEQPVAARDLDGMRHVRERSGMRVMADESLCTLADARRLVEAEAADIFNIRLGKCGGFLASARLVDVARAAGLACHLGTLVGETGILLGAAESFGRRVEEFVCLDGKGQNLSLLVQDVVEPRPQANGAGVQGLGVRILEHEMASFRVSEPRVFHR